MNKTDSLATHYELLLGLNQDWQVVDVGVSMEAKRVEIALKHTGKTACCPECEQSCATFDHAPERTWRHLDTMQFETVLRARVPRVDCKGCGVKTSAVPWAGKHSPFTWLFEAFAIAVLQSAGTTRDACKLLRIGWEGAQRIMERGVKRGLERRGEVKLKYAGMDEKSFKRGQNYISLLNDIDAGQSRVIEVVEGRDHQAAVALLESLPASQRDSVQAVAMDMWDPYLKAVKQVLPAADIVHDRYHISAHLNQAVDTVRKEEHKKLLAMGDDTLKGSKYQWLRSYEDWRSSEALSFRTLHSLDLKTSRAWHLKEDFRHFWNYRSAGAALRFYEEWRKAVIHSGLEPLKKVVRMIDEHWREVFNYIGYRISNAVSEGLNSRIQSIKSAARGFRSFANYRVRILFHCGKLDLLPSVTH